MPIMNQMWSWDPPFPIGMIVGDWLVYMRTFSMHPEPTIFTSRTTPILPERKSIADRFA
jgi:hypothetical protein